MLKRSLIVFFISCCALTQAKSQSIADTAKVFPLLEIGTRQYYRDHYDSALVNLQKAYSLVQKWNTYSTATASVLFNTMGDCYLRKGNYQKSHEFYTMALQNAGKYGHLSERQTAYSSLLEMHRIIIAKDTIFAYPKPKATEEEDIWVSFTAFNPVGDSIEVTIDAGLYDGIQPTTTDAEIYTHITKEDSLNHEAINFFGNARIAKLSNNKTILRVRKKEGWVLLSGDLVVIRANVPTSWRKLSLRNFLLRGFTMIDAYSQRLFHRRYFYYYADSLLETISMNVMSATIFETADAYAADTLTNPVLGKAVTSGIFNGKNAIRAMFDASPEHIQLFLNYINKYPATYMGLRNRFSEIFATWIIQETELDPSDIKPFLLTIRDNNERKRQIANLMRQIRENKFSDELLDKGMQAINTENIKEGRRLVSLLNDVTNVSGDSLSYGWSEYLDAFIEKRLGRRQQADSLLNVASRVFSDHKNSEGISWVNGTREQWKKVDKVVVGVQNGHGVSYILAQSNNPRYFATGGDDNLVKVWDRDLGKEILTLTEHRDEIQSIEYSRNGRYLLTASADSTICIWNAYTYALLYKHKIDRPVRKVILSPDNKYLVTAERDSLIRFRDFATGKLVRTLALHKDMVLGITFHPFLDHILYSCGADSMAYRWNLKSGEMVHWYKQKGKVISVKLSDDGKFMSLVSSDTLLTVWNTETNSKYMWSRISAHKTVGTWFGGESFSPDSRYIAYPLSTDTFNVVDLHDYYERVYPTKMNKERLADLIFSTDGQSLFARFDMGGPLRIYNFNNWDIRNKPTISWKDIQSFANLPTAVQFTRDDNSLILLHAEVSRLDLRNGGSERLFWGPNIFENRFVVLKDEKTGTYFPMADGMLHFYDIANKEDIKKFGLPEVENIASFEMSGDEKYCYLGGEEGRIAGWEYASGNQLFSRIVVKGEDPKIYRVFHDNFHKKLFLITGTDKVIMIDPFTGDSLPSITLPNANYVACSQQYIYITTGEGWLYKYNASNNELLKKIQLNAEGKGAYELMLSPDGQILVIRNSFPTIMGLRTSDDVILYDKYDHDYGGTMIRVSNDSKTFASVGFDSRVNLYETKTGKLIAHINLPINRDPVITDDEGHYLAAKSSLDAIVFSYNNNAYSFDQFDLQMNRPDIILEKLGRADTSLLKVYQAAWKKRLSRMNISEKDINSDIHLPVVSLQDRFAVQQSTELKEYEFSIECSDSKYPLKSLQVLVNNCPVLGLKGRDLTALNSQNTIQKVTVVLSDGPNNIKVYCTNSKGAISLKESFDITSKSQKDTSKIYFIGIGVANYRDSKMNLTYSAKDIRDLAKFFNNIYGNIVIDTLLDNKATKRNILALRKKLEKTTVNDRVIMAVTGHGLLSDSLDFYYGTWDIDFNKPEVNGLKYDDLENLLTDIPARQKLMLIDACHSGALDKEELLKLQGDTSNKRIVVNTGEKNVKGIAPRTFGVKNREQKMTANSSFEMMQNLFTDLNSGNGAVIISAAGGMEYAFESSTWSNGVFTYAVLRGLESNNGTKMADFEAGNFDGRVSVRELLVYVSRKVVELTGGKQKPTSRRENVDFEWMIRN